MRMTSFLGAISFSELGTLLEMPIYPLEPPSTKGFMVAKNTRSLGDRMAIDGASMCMMATTF